MRLHSQDATQDDASAQCFQTDLQEGFANHLFFQSIFTGFFPALHKLIVTHELGLFRSNLESLDTACIDCGQMLRRLVASCVYRSAPQRTLEHQEEPP
jgi:hypothetical protein